MLIWEKAWAAQENLQARFFQKLLILLSLGESRRNINVPRIRLFMAGILSFKEGVHSSRKSIAMHSTHVTQSGRNPPLWDFIHFPPFRAEYFPGDHSHHHVMEKSTLHLTLRYQLCWFCGRFFPLFFTVLSIAMYYNGFPSQPAEHFPGLQPPPCNDGKVHPADCIAGPLGALCLTCLYWFYGLFFSSLDYSQLTMGCCNQCIDKDQLKCEAGHE